MFNTNKTPFKKLGFFQNYTAHLNQLTLQVQQVFNSFSAASNGDRVNIIGAQTLKRVKMFDAFYDRFDVADEVMGATVVPFLLASGAIACTVLAAWEAGHMLAIKAGIARNDQKEHGDNTVMFFLAGLALTALSAVILVKSVLSLITRTLVTIIDGKAKPEEARFNKEPHFAQAVDVLGYKVIDTFEEDTVPSFK